MKGQGLPEIGPVTVARERAQIRNDGRGDRRRDHLPHRSRCVMDQPADRTAGVVPPQLPGVSGSGDGHRGHRPGDHDRDEQHDSGGDHRRSPPGKASPELPEGEPDDDTDAGFFQPDLGRGDQDHGPPGQQSLPARGPPGRAHEGVARVERIPPVDQQQEDQESDQEWRLGHHHRAVGGHDRVERQQAEDRDACGEGQTAPRQIPPHQRKEEGETRDRQQPHGREAVRPQPGEGSQQGRVAGRVGTGYESPARQDRRQAVPGGQRSSRHDVTGVVVEAADEVPARHQRHVNQAHEQGQPNGH